MAEREHRRQRGVAGHVFRHKTLTRWETELIEPLAHELIDTFAPRGHAELVRELTFPFPVQVIARILGLPHDDYPYFPPLSFTLTTLAQRFEPPQKASDH